MLHYFLERKRGVLSFVLNNEGAEVLSTIDSVTTACFTALVRSILSTYQNEPIIINAFECAAHDTTEFAEFIMRTLTEKARASSGKWYKFEDRASFRRFGARKKT